jgi:hypothetical protein
MVNEKKTDSSKTLEQIKNTPVKETGADSNKEAASSKQPAKPVVEDEDLVIFFNNHFSILIILHLKSDEYRLLKEELFLCVERLKV